MIVTIQASGCKISVMGSNNALETESHISACHWREHPYKLAVDWIWVMGA